MSSGIHHVTAVSGPARSTVEFYTRVLGLRLVKQTINFDDSGTHHLYFGDAEGAPGTILTFFPWADAGPGRAGTGEASLASLRVPEGALPFWTARLARNGAGQPSLIERFGETSLVFSDPHGLRLALVGIPGLADAPHWHDTQGGSEAGSGIGADQAIRGFHGVTLDVAATAGTAALLTDVLGFAAGPSEDSVSRFTAAGAPGGIVDLRIAPVAARGLLGRGSVHHVAFRAADDAQQAAMAQRISQRHRLGVTEQKDRNYFRSVYFHEPAGVLFEIATDVPGFAIDEPAASLGRSLKLPRFLEAQRRRIEAVLPDLGR